MVVRVVREEATGAGAPRFAVEVLSSGHTGVVGTFDEAETPAAERLARACAIRLATSLRCGIVSD